MVQPPRIYGHEFCGEIVAFGPGGKRPHLEKGQYVSAEMHVTCGACRPCRTGQRHICENTRILGVHGDGCFAQYVVVPAFNVVPLDPAIDPAEGRRVPRRARQRRPHDAGRRPLGQVGRGPRLRPDRRDVRRDRARLRRRRASRSPRSTASPPPTRARWAKSRGLSHVTVLELPAPRTRSGACGTRPAAAPTSCSSSPEPSRRSISGSPPRGAGAIVSLLGLPQREGRHDPRLHQRLHLQGPDAPRHHRPARLRDLDQDARPLPRGPRRRRPRDQRVRGPRGLPRGDGAPRRPAAP